MRSAAGSFQDSVLMSSAFMSLLCLDILVAKLWAAFGSPPIKNVSWDAAILHAVDMTKPEEPALSERGEHAWKVDSGQDSGVGHSVFPGYARDTADASQV